MANVTSTESKRTKQTNPHAKALAIIRARRQVVKQQVYIAKRRDLAQEPTWTPV